MTKKRVVAALTLLLSMVLILPCLTGCDNAPKEKECPKMITYDDNFIRGPAFSYNPPAEITLSLRTDVDFECNVIGDPFELLWDKTWDKTKDITIESGENLFIKANFGKDQTGKPYDLSTDGYVTIIAKESDHIVGYAILLIKSDFSYGSSPNGWYVSTLKAVEFPQIEGQYQDVSEKYVQRQFKKLMK